MSLSLPPTTEPGAVISATRCGARTRAAVGFPRARRGLIRPDQQLARRRPTTAEFPRSRPSFAVSVGSAVPEEVSVADVVPDIASIDDSLPPSRSCIESEAYLAHDGDGNAHGDEGEEWEAALLITGTAVGGGSLALPYFCAAGGFVPAVGLLAIAWAALLASSLTLVEPTIRVWDCLLYTSPSPRDQRGSRMPSSA